MLNKDRKKGKHMKTNDLEKTLGLSKHTIRYYEKEGFIHPVRDENGYRNYSDEDIQVLQLVKFLRNLNISIDDVKAIIKGSSDFQECLKINQVHLEKQIESMKEVKQTIDFYKQKDLPLIPALTDIPLSQHQSHLGFQKTTQSVSLGRKLTKAWAIRKIFYAIIPSLLGGIVGLFIFEFAGLELSKLLKGLIFIVFFIITEMISIASSFQNSSLYLRDTLDHSMNQSIEFLSTGIRYYCFEGFRNNLKYFIAVLLGNDERNMYHYSYEEIEEVKIDIRKRYMSVGSPMAYEVYVPDFAFRFHDGNQFYFYWPLTLDDDLRYIAYILEDKVKNIKDDNNILYALKNGINLNDYMVDE